MVEGNELLTLLFAALGKAGLLVGAHPFHDSTGLDFFFPSGRSSESVELGSDEGSDGFFFANVFFHLRLHGTKAVVVEEWGDELLEELRGYLVGHLSVDTVGVAVNRTVPCLVETLKGFDEM